MKTKFIILPHTGIIENNNLWLEGQVLSLKDKYLNVKSEESLWKNIYRLFKFYTPKKLKRETIIIEYKNHNWHVQTNHYGYFSTKLSLNSALTQNFEHDQLSYKLFNHTPIKIPEAIKEQIFAFSSEHTGVISDIDDTILTTYATNTFRRLAVIFRNNPLKRKEVQKMPVLYKHFQEEGADFFYVSNSEMNLYWVIRTFLDNKHFPEGAVYLKPFKKLNELVFKRKKKGKNQHKFDKIRFLLNINPNKRFVLVGDSGQNDPYIYYSIALEFPKQIKSIFIRDMNCKPAKVTLIKQFQEKLNNIDIPLIFFKHAEEIIKQNNMGNYQTISRHI